MKRLLKENIWLILITGILLPVIIFAFEKAAFPEVIDHIIKRLPLNINNIIPTIISIVLGTFLEELIYRQVLQYIISKFVNVPAAVIISSAIFAFMHRTPGTFIVVVLDLSGVFLDSVLYGIIFNRSNVLFSWIAHCLSDLTALAVLKLFL